MGAEALEAAEAALCTKAAEAAPRFATGPGEVKGGQGVCLVKVGEIRRKVGTSKRRHYRQCLFEKVGPVVVVFFCPPQKTRKGINKKTSRRFKGAKEGFRSSQSLGRMEK